MPVFVKRTSAIKFCGYVLTEFHDNIENSANLIDNVSKIQLSLHGILQNLRLFTANMRKSHLPIFNKISEEILLVQLDGNLVCPYIKCDCQRAHAHDTNTPLLDS